MLALPPDCAAFCASARRTPAELYDYVTGTLSDSGIDPRHYNLTLDWCCMAAQPGTGTNASSSLVSFAMPAILGSTEHLHEWAHSRLHITLGLGTASKKETPGQPEGCQQLTNHMSWAAGQSQMEVTMIAQVTAAVMAAVRAGGSTGSTDADPRGTGKPVKDPRTYSEYQLAKLKGFCCIRTNAALPTI